MYTEADIDSARRLRECAVDLLAKTESYPSLRSRDRYLPDALLIELTTSMTAIVSPVVVRVLSSAEPSSDVASTKPAVVVHVPSSAEPSSDVTSTKSAVVVHARLQKEPAK